MISYRRVRNALTAAILLATRYIEPLSDGYLPDILGERNTGMERILRNEDRAQHCVRFHHIAFPLLSLILIVSPRLYGVLYVKAEYQLYTAASQFAILVDARDSSKLPSSFYIHSIRVGRLFQSLNAVSALSKWDIFNMPTRPNPRRCFAQALFIESSTLWNLVSHNAEEMEYVLIRHTLDASTRQPYSYRSYLPDTVHPTQCGHLFQITRCTHLPNVTHRTQHSGFRCICYPRIIAGRRTRHA
jgi:hypothetical protein